MTMRKRGITLVELILVVVVMAIIMAALAPYIGAIQRTWQWGDRRTEMMQHGRVSLDRMVKTLRNCITIVAIDGDTGQGKFIEFITPNGDYVRYFDKYDTILKQTDLFMRTISGGVSTTSLLAEAVQSITFSYYKYEIDSDTSQAVRVPATSAGEVEAVDIAMQMSDPEGEITSTLPLTSFVFRRIKASGGWAVMIGEDGVRTCGGKTQQTSDGGYVIFGFKFSGFPYPIYIVKLHESGAFQWSSLIQRGAPGNGQQTFDGGYMIAGTVLTKTDTDGNEEWSKSLGSKKYAFSGQQIAGGGYILAGYDSTNYTTKYFDGYIAKHQANGTYQWGRIYGGTDEDFFHDIQKTRDGGYIMVGETKSYGAGGSDIWLFKTDASGNEQWSKTFGGSATDQGYSVRQTTDGGYIITGNWYSFPVAGAYLLKTDTSGDEEWSTVFSGNASGYAVQQTSDGGYVVAGKMYVDAESVFDGMLVKTDANGNEEWRKTYGGARSDRFTGVQQTTDGGYIAGGETMSFGAPMNTTEWIYFIKTDANGNCPAAENPTKIYD